MFTKVSDWVMGLLVRFVLATFAIALVFSFVLYSWVYEKRLNLTPGVKMDRELRQYLKWVVIAAFVIIIANLVACARPTPVAIIPLEEDDAVLGRVSCDSVKNVPIIGLAPRLDSAQRTWVLLHERIHLSQIKDFGKGCMAFSKRYISDLTFRLKIEAEAFCGVYFVQTAKKVSPEPTLDGIMWRLLNRYDAVWSPIEVSRAMTCLPP